MKKIAFALFLTIFLAACGNAETLPQAANAPTQQPPVYVNFGEEVVKNSMKYLNVRETKNRPNRGIEIDRFHDYVGLEYGNPWCMMFVEYNWYEVLRPYGLEPHIKTARVSTYYQHALKHKYLYQVKTAKGIIYGAQTPEKGDIVIWIKGVGYDAWDNFNGHTGETIRYVEKPTDLETIEGNTGPGDQGDQREGDGVYVRRRSILLGKDFRIDALIKPYYPETVKK